jgi:hypothetical protein
MEISMFPQKTENRASSDPAVPFLGIHPKELESICIQDACTLMCIAALFTIANIWNQTWCPTTDD